MTDVEPCRIFQHCDIAPFYRFVEKTGVIVELEDKEEN